MRRRRTQEGDSLDLLLDAITNTFGGVLFLAVLVVILLQFTGDPTKQVTVPNAQASQQLENEIKEQEEVLAGLLGGHGERLVEEYIDLWNQFERLSKETDEQSDPDTQRKEGIENALRIAKAKQRKIELENQVEEIEEKASRSAKMPRLRTTKKSEFPLLICNNRLHLLYKVAPGSTSGDLLRDSFDTVTNANDQASGCVETIDKTGNPMILRPKPSSGIPLGSEKKIRQMLEEKLQKLTPRKSYLAIAIWEDSFESFGNLRNALVEIGYEYRLILMEQGSVVGQGRIDGEGVIIQ